MRLYRTVTEEALDELKVGDNVNIIQLRWSMHPNIPMLHGFNDTVDYRGYFYSSISLPYRPNCPAKHHSNLAGLQTVTISHRSKRTFQFTMSDGRASKINKYYDLLPSTLRGASHPNNFLIVKDVQVIDYDEDDCDCI